uniref:Uncharacterized protein n=1 Tax=Anguilla anguilla TaxID=7936 RepID=A0A0E9SPH8_ANGAN
MACLLSGQEPPTGHAFFPECFYLTFNTNQALSYSVFCSSSYCI